MAVNVSSTAAGRSGTATARTGSPRTERLAGLWFVLPFLALFAAFMIWPVVSGLWQSFFNVSLAGGEASFLGLDNWTEMIGDAAVWDSLWNTVAFTLMSTPPLVAIALVMALLANRSGWFGWLLRFAYFAPFVLPVAVVTLIWVWMYQPGFGLVNAFLTGIGLPEVGWLNDESVAMLSVVITTTWWTVGFNFLLYLAALQGIPQHLYEAAAVDGASPRQRLWRVTLPMLRRTTGLIVVLQLVASLKIFDQIYLMLDGGPNNSTRPIIQYIYETGFTSYRIGYASAISYMFFAVIILISVAQFRLFSGRKEESQ
ncbi:carbohydrate ABC transporter membrane protein 1 (CUT1 family) [Haloactinopolyspora alba]|uniref:Carbohydrate ABC transporter membrane protein 1 (CUT1 family) n=1 Tax=Haloactinopolyspora alba TaxID=648780 RepID=A0A2P8E6Y9_9ACTN|nr:sugar ABC transporter permease [Haloactinopolyspora alba]PSL05229.1 carbohydrate ABC transporter membrane protein 1 (CUT1 family) [Haloactinopolyspora alba]